ncbi:MAG TPA: CHAD domain-containing protein [Edaphobacter sp.]|jgi:CHAD domain-containing protein|nr:CHAD domain-containing protein [Edaphobacter sp.]
MPQPVTVFLRQALMLKAAIPACLKKAAPDRVHHLRSTTRRIEATLELLVLSANISRIKKESKPLERSLRKVRRAAGAVRDADVQSDLLATYNRTPDSKLLREDLTAVRKKAERKLTKRLEQEQKKIELRLNNLEAILSPALELSLSGAKLITVTQSWFAENVRGLDPQHDQDLHTLRKASKTARYLAEIGGDASKAAATLAARYEAAQKSLGEWHDHFLLLHQAHTRLPPNSETIEQIQEDTERLHQRADDDASHLLATA